MNFALAAVPGVIGWEGVLAGLKAGGYSGRLAYEPLHGTFAELWQCNERMLEISERV